jgi:ammonia channel protein AmtB
VGTFAGLFMHGGSGTLLRWQVETAAWVIVFNIIVTYVLLKLIGLVIPLRHSDADLEIGDHAIHGHEVYPADVATLGSFGSVPLQPPGPAAQPASGA